MCATESMMHGMKSPRNLYALPCRDGPDANADAYGEHVEKM